MARKPIPIDEVLTLLEQGPQRIAAATAALMPAQLATPPAPGEWSANEVLAHLRSCGDVWGGCIERILAEDHPTLRAVDPRTWTEQTDYRELPFQDSFAAFSAQRAALLARLADLAPADWERGATVTGAGRPLERTVHFYAQWLARHERPHVKQIERAALAVGA